MFCIGPLGVLGIGLVMAALAYLLWRWARYRRRVARLLTGPKKFDLVRGDLATGQVHSPSRFALFRKWGLPLPPEVGACALATLGVALGRDLQRDCAESLAAMKAQGRDSLISEHEVYCPQEGCHRRYRRHLHCLGGGRFMACLEDITFENEGEARPENAPTPHLAELLTRQSMCGRLTETCGQLRAQGGRAFLIMLDIDNFRKINDSYGHDVGDAALRAVSNIVRGTDHGQALTARWGGEEFLVCVDRWGEEEAQETAKGLLRLVAAAEVGVAGSDKIVKLTVSAGVAELDSDNHIISIQRADKALYEAKYDGKNCVRLWRPEKGPALPELKPGACCK